MHARQMAAMAEATRLTRQGRLVEATALIQRTLASPAVTRRPPDAPSAGEETSRTPDRHPDPSPALRAGVGTPLGQVQSGWLTRRRTLPSRNARVCAGRSGQRPRPPRGRRAGLRPSPTPTPPAPAPTGSTFPPATAAAPSPWS